MSVLIEYDPDIYNIDCSSYTVDGRNLASTHIHTDVLFSRMLILLVLLVYGVYK